MHSRRHTRRVLALLAGLAAVVGCHERTPTASVAPTPPSASTQPRARPSAQPEDNHADARARLREFDGEAALAMYTRLLEANSADAMAGLGLAQTGLEFGLEQPATSVLERVLDGDETEAVGARLGLALLAHAHYEAQLDAAEFESGEFQLRNVLAVDGGNPHALALAVLLYLLRADRRGDGHAALALAICQDHEPIHASLAASCGEEALRRGDPARARELFDRAIQADPEHGGAWLRWGLLELGVGNLHVARHAFEQAARSPWPSIRVSAHATLGVTLDRLGDTPAAITAYREALQLCERSDHPIPPDLLFDFGVAASRLASSDIELSEAQTLLELYLASGDPPPPRQLQVQHALAELASVRAEHERAQR